jgi:hypothetical protein
MGKVIVRAGHYQLQLVLRQCTIDAYGRKRKGFDILADADLGE